MPLSRIYFTGFVFAANLALTAYINSSFLEHQVGVKYISLLFSLSAVVTFIGLQKLPSVLSRLGNRKTSLYLLFGIVMALLVLMRCHNPFFIGLFFVIYIACNNLFVYCLDIFVEHFSKRTSTGKIRGFYLSITNLGWVLAPTVAGIIVSTYGFSTLYGVVLIIVALVIIILATLFKHFTDAKYHKMSLRAGINFIRKKVNIRRIIRLNFLLQFFFSWMVIYTPIYLREVIGFDFKTIGLIFMIMLMPFVFLQYPLGRIADKYLGEKELLISGFLVMGVSTLVFGLYQGANPFIWALILFMTRVGASTIEVMCDTYFFKQINDNEPEVISLFRTTAPFAYIIAPLIGALLLLLIPFQMLYIILGLFVLVGAALSFRLVDTN